MKDDLIDKVIAYCEKIEDDATRGYLASTAYWRLLGTWGKNSNPKLLKLKDIYRAINPRLKLTDAKCIAAKRRTCYIRDEQLRNFYKNKVFKYQILDGRPDGFVHRNPYRFQSGNV